MPDDTPKIGDIRYDIYVDDEDGHDYPWVARLECIHISPKGKSAHWLIANSVSKRVIKGELRAGYRTIAIAVRAFQEGQFTRPQFWMKPNDKINYGRRVRLILEAEELKTKTPPNTIDRFLSRTAKMAVEQ